MLLPEVVQGKSGEMDHEQREQLSDLVEELTTSGEPQLNPAKMKEVKKICKSSDEYIDHVYHLIMTQLSQQHAEIRLSAFQIASELFTRSHHFRTLLVNNFQQFLELTVETDPSDQPLPPPKEVAQKLKTMAIKAVQEWQSSYGEAYKKLALGYHFLKQVKKVDFQDVQARTLAERKREEERQRRLERIYNEKVKRAEREMQEAFSEIQDCLTEMENCLKLLIPEPFDFSIADPQGANPEPGASDTAGPSLLFCQAVHSGKESPTIDDEQPCCSKGLQSLSEGSVGQENGTRASVQEKEDDSEEDSDMESVSDQEMFIRNTGIISHKYSLSLDISTDLKVQETEDNDAVINTIRDLHRLITTKHLPAVLSWVQVFTKAGVNDDRLKQAIDWKKALEVTLKKHQDMHIDYKRRDRKVPKAAADSEEEDDFEDVPEKEGYEPHIPDHLREEYGLGPVSSSELTAVKAGKPAPPATVRPQPRAKRRENEEEQDPTCAAATLRVLKQRLPTAKASSMPESSESAASTLEPRGETGTEQEEKARAPVMPFGLDLYYWGQDQPTAGKILKFSSQHQFWVPHEVEEEVENEELSALMKSRYITFPGKYVPVEHKCRAPMPNGTLCERQDRVKCPFHGVIIPRDELGNPINPEDVARLEREKRKQQEEQPDWRDPELMREIEAATGVDLGSSKSFGKGKKGSKGKGKKKKYPNLTDLKQKSNTARSRLQKKVFNTRSVKRVTEAMNRIDKRKHEKFSNQFNYALN
nr:PREDICTED: UV-stimulated scaffold protein A isoform X2 [Lepisosteus oculatus]